MGDVTRILAEIESGDARAAEDLLPLVYEELRKLATRRMAQEPEGHTLQPTALVHEAYLRLVDVARVQHWKSRAHFFGAAAEAMRRILVERARRVAAPKHGGDRRRVDWDKVEPAVSASVEDLIALDEALERLERSDALAARVVNLRYFAGLSLPQVADALDLSLRTVERNWTYARTWLRRDLAPMD